MRPTPRGSAVRCAVSLAAVGLAATACTSSPDPDPDPGDRPSASVSTPSEQGSPTESVSPGGTSSPSPTATTAPVRLVRPADLRLAVAAGAVDHLAGTIGPRHATSPAYRRAARWVTGELQRLGWAVSRRPVAVPDGTSWGVPVTAGTSQNVVATPPGFDSRQPHLVVGAHLDTVPQAPGAEDNASGVGVLLAVAAALEGRRARFPVVLVAFGAEEPRGPSDADHHYGSRAYVDSLAAAERRAVRGMLSLDRVGVGTVVPVCAAIGAATAARADALAAAGRAGVAAQSCENSSSDHWSFVRRGMPGVRIGGTSYAGYHSAQDVPSVVSRPQLERAGRLVLAWLAGPRSR